MASDGGSADVAEPYQSYKTSTNYFLQWLWVEYRLRAPEAAKTHTFKSTKDILRAAETLAATATTVPPTVIDSLRNAIKKRQEVLRIYQDLGSDDAAHKAFLRRLQETLAVIDPLVPKPSTLHASTPEVDSLVATNRFSALRVQEYNESSSIETFLSETQKEPPEMSEAEREVAAALAGNIVLEDDSIMIRYKAMSEGMAFIRDLYNLRIQLEHYWTDVAEGKMSFALASWLTSAAVSQIQSFAPSTWPRSMQYLTDNTRLASEIYSQAKKTEEVAASTIISEIHNLNHLMALVWNQGGHPPMNLELPPSVVYVDALSGAKVDISTMSTFKKYVTGPKNAKPWDTLETYAFVIPEILDNIEQALCGKRSIETFEKGFHCDLSAADLDLMQKLSSGQISKQALWTRLPEMNPEHAMTPENQEFLENSTTRHGTREPLIIPALQHMRNGKLVNVTTLYVGIQILIPSSKAFFWPRGVKQKEWNCGLRPLRLAMEMKKKLVPVTQVIKRFVKNRTAVPGRLKQAEDLHRALDEYTKGMRWDLYHQTPWTAGCHLNELLLGASTFSQALYDSLPVIPAVLHLYNVLCMSDVELAKIQVLEELCEFFKASAFNGTRPKANFLTHSRCSLYYDWKRPAQFADELIRRPFLFESMYFTQHASDHNLDYATVAKLHNINAKLPFNEVTEAKLFSLRKGMDIGSYLEKAERMAKKDFEPCNPVANIDYLHIFNLCSKVLDTFGTALYESSEDSTYEMAKEDAVVLGSKMVETVLGRADKSRNKGRSVRKNLRHRPIFKEAISALDTVDKKMVLRDLCWEV